MRNSLYPVSVETLPSADLSYPLYQFFLFLIFLLLFFLPVARHGKTHVPQTGKLLSPHVQEENESWNERNFERFGRYRNRDFTVEVDGATRENRRERAAPDAKRSTWEWFRGGCQRFCKSAKAVKTCVEWTHARAHPRLAKLVSLAFDSASRNFSCRQLPGRRWRCTFRKYAQLGEPARPK